MQPTLPFANRATNYLILFVTLVATILLGELVLGYSKKNIPVYGSLPSGEPYPSEYSSYLPFTLPKDVEMKHFEALYRFNRFGFRGPEIERKKQSNPKERRRLVLLGDSFTFGWRMNEQDTFPAKLQNVLDANGFSHHVINAGYHSGYSPDAYYASLVSEWDYFSPDLVLIALFMGNDVVDINDNIWLKTDARGMPTKLKTIRNYFNHSGKLNIGKQWYYQLPLLRDSKIFIGLVKLLESLQLDGKSTLKGRNIFLEVLSGIHALLVEKKVAHLFILIPPFGGDSFNLNDSGLKHTKQFIAETLGAPVFDLSETFSNQTDLSKLVIPRDGHFSVHGNSIVADELYRHLISSGLITR